MQFFLVIQFKKKTKQKKKLNIRSNWFEMKTFICFLKFQQRKDTLKIYVIHDIILKYIEIKTNKLFKSV